MDPQPKHRARTIEEFLERQQHFVAASRAAYGEAPLRARPGDVIIAPYGKCGTTILQQMFHCLRTRGDMEFDDISRMVPWIEMSPILGLDLNADQKAEPRGFKSHLSYTSLPKGARCVVSLRDPKDAFVSMYRFMEGWMIEPGTIPMEDFFTAWAKGGGPEGESYWHHLMDWWAVRDRPDVLLFSYSRMIRDREVHVRRLAQFAGIELDSELVDLTVERTSRDYMLAHKDRFDDRLMRELSERGGRLPPGSDSAKVRAGSTGNHKDEIPSSVADQIDAIWRERVTPVTGFTDFSELEAAL